MQGRHREVTSEGSVEQSRDLTNRNRIRGIPGGTSGRLIAKSISINSQGCRSGRCAGKAIKLTWGDLRHVLLWDWGDRKVARSRRRSQQRA